MRRKEVQRHVAPIVAFLGIALEYGHEFDNCDPEVFQIRDLFNHARIGARSRCMHAGIGILGETLHVQFVDDRIRFRPRRYIFDPVKRNATYWQDSQRCLSAIGSRLRSQLAIKCRWEKHALRVGIEKNLLVIESVEPRNYGS